MGKTTKNHFITSELTEQEKAEYQQYLADKKRQEQEESERLSRQQETSVDFMSAEFEPFEDRVLVYPDPVEKKTAGGLYKPEEAVNKVKPMKGTIVRVGPGKATINTRAMVLALGYESENMSDIRDGGQPRWSLSDFENLLKNEDKNFAPGDRVFYGNYAGTEFVLNDIKYLIMRTTDIFGRVPKGA